MTFILDMSSGKKYAGEEFSCPQQKAEKSQQPHIDSNADHPTLQIETVESTTSGRQLSAGLPGLRIDTLLASLED